MQPKLVQDSFFPMQNKFTGEIEQRKVHKSNKIVRYIPNNDYSLFYSTPINIL